MCHCNPLIRTPYCGVGKCVWPKQIPSKEERAKELKQQIADSIRETCEKRYVGTSTKVERITVIVQEPSHIMIHVEVKL